MSEYKYLKYKKKYLDLKGGNPELEQCKADLVQCNILKKSIEETNEILFNENEELIKEKKNIIEENKSYIDKINHDFRSFEEMIKKECQDKYTHYEQIISELQKNNSKLEKDNLELNERLDELRESYLDQSSLDQSDSAEILNCKELTMIIEDIRQNNKYLEDENNSLALEIDNLLGLNRALQDKNEELETKGDPAKKPKELPLIEENLEVLLHQAETSGNTEQLTFFNDYIAKKVQLCKLRKIFKYLIEKIKLLSNWTNYGYAMKLNTRVTWDNWISGTNRLEPTSIEAFQTKIERYTELIQEIKDQYKDYDSNIFDASYDAEILKINETCEADKFK